MKYLVDSTVPAIEKLSPLVEMAADFFRAPFREKREQLKSLIRDIRQHEHDADHYERELIHKVFETVKDPLQAFYLIRLVETIGSIADHAQNASDMMRAMLSK